jgi:hypothetical protein
MMAFAISFFMSSEELINSFLNIFSEDAREAPQIISIVTLVARFVYLCSAKEYLALREFRYDMVAPASIASTNALPIVSDGPVAGKFAVGGCTATGGCVGADEGSGVGFVEGFTLGEADALLEGVGEG